jgi:hypothetical protein
VCIDRGKESDSAQGGWRWFGWLAKRSAWKVIVKINCKHFFTLLLAYSQQFQSNGIEISQKTHNFIHFIFVVIEHFSSVQLVASNPPSCLNIFVVVTIAF